MIHSKLRPPLIIVPAVLAIGFTTGFLVRPTLNQLFSGGHIGNTLSAHDEEHEIDVHEEEDEEPHVALTPQACKNLRLTIEPVEISDYTQTIRMPGEIQESPGYSIQKVAAPVSGTVTRLFAIPGISVTEGVPLFELEIIDDDLMTAQLRLLELLTSQEITDAELQRLKPLASAGGVAGRKLLEWEYKKKEVIASLARTRQELLMRGLSAEEIEQILTSGKTISKITVRAPSATSKPNTAGISETSGTGSQVQLTTWPLRFEDRSDLTVEKLLVDSGQNIERGEPVCMLAAHAMLSVCGHAFENEVSTVSELMDRKESVDIEFGIEGYCSNCNGLKIQYVDSHVDPQTQTYRFFVPLPNEVVTESTDSLGRRFRTWRYKVGQKVHVLVPNRVIKGGIVLPRDAVVQDGANAFVFREHEHGAHDEHIGEDEHLQSEELATEHEEELLELEPVAVTVLHRDKSVAVVAAGEQLKEGDHVAMCSAYQLLLAMKAEQDGGGGHHHHH